MIKEARLERISKRRLFLLVHITIKIHFIISFTKHQDFHFVHYIHMSQAACYSDGVLWHYNADPVLLILPGYRQSRNKPSHHNTQHFSRT